MPWLAGVNWRKPLWQKKKRLLCSKNFTLYPEGIKGKNRTKKTWLEALLKDGTPAPATKCSIEVLLFSLIKRPTNTLEWIFCLVLSQEDLIDLRVQILFTSKFLWYKKFSYSNTYFKVFSFLRVCGDFSIRTFFLPFFFGRGGLLGVGNKRRTYSVRMQ